MRDRRPWPLHVSLPLRLRVASPAGQAAVQGLDGGRAAVWGESQRAPALPMLPHLNASAATRGRRLVQHPARCRPEPMVGSRVEVAV